MEINKDTLKRFRHDFSHLAKVLEDEFGVTIKLGNISYDNTGFKTSMTVVNGEGVDIQSMQLEKDFLNNCWKYGMIDTDLHRVFTYQGDEYQIVGMKPRSKKYPFVVKHLTSGKLSKFSKQIINF